MAVQDMTNLQYQAVYNVLSLALASMMAATLYLWFRAFAVKEQYQSAVLISGLVTFIEAYHYTRIFNSWVGAYKYSPGAENPTKTDVPFNDAYHYIDWLATAPLLLIAILLVMKRDEATSNMKTWTLRVCVALVIVSGYYLELTITCDSTPRWECWVASMCFFLYIIYELFVGLEAAASEADEVIKSKIQVALVAAFVGWCTFPVVYLFPKAASGATEVVLIQIVYCFCDVFAKCVVGLVIYQISYAKSEMKTVLP